MTSSNPDLIPQERGGWRRWLWVIWAGLTSAIVVASYVLFLSEISIPAQRTFAGTLRPSHSQFDLNVPANIPLKAILVSAGDVVTPGQTLALLDADTIKSQLSKMNSDLLLNTTLRKCLLNKTSLENTDTVIKGLDPETRLRFRVTIRGCQLTHQSNALRLKKILDVRDSFQTHNQLSQKRFALALEKAKSAGQRAAIAIQVTANRNQAASRLKKLELEISELATNQEKQILVQSRKLEQEAEQLYLRRDILSEFIVHPRLFSPKQGHVLRTRQMPPNGEYPVETALITLQSKHRKNFVSHFDLQQHIAHKFRIGDTVMLSVIGLRLNPAKLPGKITQITPLSGGTSLKGMTRITVQLEDQYEDQLKHGKQGIIIEDASTISTVTFSLGKQNLWQSLQRMSQNMFSGNV